MLLFKCLFEDYLFMNFLLGIAHPIWMKFDMYIKNIKNIQFHNYIFKIHMIKLYMGWGLYLTLRFLLVWVEGVLTTLVGLLIHIDQARTPINPLLPTPRHHGMSRIREDILEPALFFFFLIIHSWDIKVSCILFTWQVSINLCMPPLPS